MKNTLMLLGILGFSLMGFSQVTDNDKEAKEVKLEEVTVTPIVNFSYQNLVREDTTPDYVQNLQDEVARYDVTQDPNFNGDYEAYEVIFSQTNGRIIATYDQDGKVISTFEKFKNVTPPESVRNSIYELYPNWTIHKDIYRVTYFQGEDVKKIYQLQVRKDNQKKNIKVDTKGNIL
ncbi:hypothetical protein SAMN04487911_11023 [Arenibacter nanhaiticus]|uniref:Nicotinate-nucleotide adenylyltransferase n=1 Tax=Arenibacter nanhaiticus TaxID=558155 RepID=A0A1M6G448_9FLAO|nr:hypothetical protein [Arenibacter nanhaiticus]SHJ04785.1 hypothetical protein SAMN04487911_11023 [Arenibacter nanhaiticus]